MGADITNRYIFDENDRFLILLSPSCIAPRFFRSGLLQHVINRHDSRAILDRYWTKVRYPRLQNFVNQKLQSRGLLLIHP